MLKSYQFINHCKGNVHSSKTANIILPGLTTKYKWMPLRVQAKSYCNSSAWMLVETTHVTDLEYYRNSHGKFVQLAGFDWSKIQYIGANEISLMNVEDTAQT